ncbi:MAG: HD domain-containing protein [Sedimentibacter sp.]|uniref:HD domain-containing protein n=1 Tax=Sedimentibacter sp. TaxID=1960295 RepID=UPI003159416A
MIHKAIEFAAKAHRNQERKASDVPYIVHPYEVAHILTKSGCQENVIVAGLLHDTVEDTHVEIEDIEREFGSETARLVSKVSEDKSKSWEERKQHTIDYIRCEADLDVMLLSCADKLSNMRSMKEDFEKIGEELWSRFNRPKEKQSWYYGELIDAFEPLFDYEMYWELSDIYSDLFATYYIDKCQELIVKTNEHDYYGYSREQQKWVRDEKLKDLIDKGEVSKIEKNRAVELVKQWNEQN